MSDKENNFSASAFESNLDNIQSRDARIPNKSKIPPLAKDKTALNKYLKTKKILENKVFPKVRFNFE